MLYQGISPVEQDISHRLTLLLHGRKDAHPLQLLLLLALCNTNDAPLDQTSFPYRRPTSLAIGLTALTPQNPKATAEMTDYLFKLSQDIITTNKFPESSHLVNETETLFQIVMAIPAAQQEKFIDALIIAQAKMPTNNNPSYYFRDENYAREMLYIVTCCPFRGDNNYPIALRTKALMAITPEQQPPANQANTINSRNNSFQNFLFFLKRLYDNTNLGNDHEHILEKSLIFMGRMGYDIFATNIFKIEDFRTRKNGNAILRACVPAISPPATYLIINQLFQEVQLNPDYAAQQNRPGFLLASIMFEASIKTAPTYQYLSSSQIQNIHTFFKLMTATSSVGEVINIMMKIELQIVNQLSTEHKREITEALKTVERNPTRFKLFHSVCAFASPQTLVAEISAMMNEGNNPARVLDWSATQLDILIQAMPHIPGEFKEKLTKSALNKSFSFNITKLLIALIDQFSTNKAIALLRQILNECAHYYSYSHNENELHDVMQLIKLLIHKISNDRNYENYPDQFFSEVLKKMQSTPSSGMALSTYNTTIIFAKILTFIAPNISDVNRLILLKNLSVLHLKVEHYYLLPRLLMHCTPNNPELNNSELDIPSVLISFVDKIIEDLNRHNKGTHLNEYPVLLGHIIQLNFAGDFNGKLLEKMSIIIDISTSCSTYNTVFKKIIPDLFLVYIELMKKMPMEIFKQNIAKIIEYFRYFNSRTLADEKFLISTLKLFPLDRRQLIIEQCKNQYGLEWLAEDLLFLNPGLNPTSMNDIIVTGNEKIAAGKKAHDPSSTSKHFELCFHKGLSHSLLYRFSEISDKALLYLMDWANQVIKKSYGKEVCQAVFGKVLFTYLLPLSQKPIAEFIDFAQEFKGGIYECLIAEIEQMRQNNMEEAIALLEKIVNPQMTDIFPLTQLFQDERGLDYISGLISFSYLEKIKNLRTALLTAASAANANNGIPRIAATVPSYHQQANNNNSDNENPNEFLNDPVTMTTLVDPVTLPSGHTYSRQTLINTRAAHRDRLLICPVTREDCSYFDEVNAPVNITLQKLIRQSNASSSSSSSHNSL
ncbi:MAG: U-box domain-containing protein [Legionellales bacterium]